MAKELPLSTPKIRKSLRESLRKLPKRTWEWNKVTPQVPPLQNSSNGKGHAYELLCLLKLVKKLWAKKMNIRFAGGDVLHFNQSPGDLDCTRSYLVVYQGKTPLGVLATDVVFYRHGSLSAPDPLNLDKHEVDVTFCCVTNDPDDEFKVKILDSDLVVSLFCKNKPWTKGDFREFMGFVRVQGWRAGYPASLSVLLRRHLMDVLGQTDVTAPYLWLDAPISGFASPTIRVTRPVDIPGEQTAHLLRIR